jgi:hypothetical protein
MKSSLQHLFVLDALDHWCRYLSHFEVPYEHVTLEASGKSQPSSLRQLVPTIELLSILLP